MLDVIFWCTVVWWTIGHLEIFSDVDDASERRVRSLRSEHDELQEGES
jgi:hypothetical protein